MKKILLYCSLSVAFISCNNNSNLPDVSNISVELGVKRFDTDVFSIPPGNASAGMGSLLVKYPALGPIFFQTILGIEDTTGFNDFYARYKPIYDSSQKIYADFDPVKEEIVQAFKYVKHYFPSYDLPASIATVVGPMNSRQDLAQMPNGDYTPNFLGSDFVGISLQFYLGKDFSLYDHEYFITNVAPLYLSRRFSRDYIVGDVMKLITDDLFPDNSKGKPLIEQMIERGKQWWLVDKFLPKVADSIKTGYTGQQVEWCEKNEGLIWSHIIKYEDLYSLNPATLQTYIGESPFTAVFSQELSPGNIGQWIGWQIVKKFESGNPKLKVEAIMKSSPKAILDGARYKPK